MTDGSLPHLNVALIGDWDAIGPPSGFVIIEDVGAV